MEMTPHEIWRSFFNKPGSEVDGRIGIGSYNAVHGLYHTVATRDIHRALEIGSGIGTLTYTMLAAARDVGRTEFALVTVENEPFCLSQLALNLQRFDQCYTVVPNVTDVHSGEHGLFDLIVIDGGGDKGNDAGLQNFSGLLAPGGMIFVEGDRSYQRKQIPEMYRSRSFACACHRSPFPTVRSLHPRLGIMDVSNKSYWTFAFEATLMTRIGLSLTALWGVVTLRLLRKLPIFRSKTV